MPEVLEEIDAQRWRRVAGVVEVALELDRATRAAYLETLGRQDEDLRHRVLAILRSLGAIQSDDEPTEDGAASPGSAAEDRIGPWRVVRLLGRGGMGAVFLAERDDDEYQRQVAIKVIGTGFQAPSVYRRFLAERQILAAFDHAHIAKLFDAGTARDGRPYFVMEYVEGEPIDRYCFARELSLEQRLALFRKVCSAVAYAHRQLVVHRDLKPTNILVGADGEPKLLDFGIAKLLEPGSLVPFEMEATRLTQAVMTPKWASPEQLRGEAISTSSDVYSLGLLLFKLLTGALPTRGTWAITASSEESTTRPSRLLESPAEQAERAWPAPARQQAARRLRGDLDNIVLKALRPEPEKRYPSVESFDEDIERFLDGRPVSASRDTPLYLLRKLSLRYRWQLTAAALLLLAIVSVAGVALFQAEEVRRERDQTLIARELAEKQARLAEKQARLAEKQARRAEGSLQFLSDLLRAADETERLQQVLSVRDLLTEGLDRLESGAVANPEATVDLLELIASAFRDFRDLPSAIRAQRLAHETALAGGLPEDERTRLLANLARLQIYSGDQSNIRQICNAILRSSVQSDIRLSCLDALGILAAFQGDQREQARLARLSLDEVARQQGRGKGLSRLSDLATMGFAGLLDTEESVRLLRHTGRTAVHELSPEAARRLLLKVARHLLQMLLAQDDLPSASRIVAWLEAHQPSSHRHDTVAGNQLLGLAIAHRRLGRFDEAMAVLELIDGIGRSMVEVEPGHLRGRWLLATVPGQRAKVWRDLGREDRARPDFDRAAEGFRALYEENAENFFIQRAFAFNLMEAGDIDEARPLVHSLIESGFRWPPFLELAERRGLLPDPMPPPVELDTSIPPALQARFDAARHVRLPWEQLPRSQEEGSLKQKAAALP